MDHPISQGAQAQEKAPEVDAEAWDMEAELEKDADEAWAALEAEAEREREFERDAEEAWAALEAEAEREREFDEALEATRKLTLHAEAARKFDEAIQQAELEWERETNRAVEDGHVRCTACGIPTSRPVFLKEKPHSAGFTHAPKADRNPYCVGCTEKIAVKWLGRHGELQPLSEAQVSKKVFQYLFPYCRGDAVLVVADHFGFCRCCFDAAAPLNAPGEPCDACRLLQRCAGCGRFARLVTRHPGGFLCQVCAPSAGPSSLRSGSKGQRRADWVTGETAPKPKCFRCAEPTYSASRMYCSACREHLLSLPGEKCSGCKVQPKAEGEGHRRCQDCRARSHETHAKPR